MTTVIVDTGSRKIYMDTRATTTEWDTNIIGMKCNVRQSYDDSFYKLWCKREFIYASAGNVEEIEKFVYLHGTKRQFVPKYSVIIELRRGQSGHKVHGGAVTSYNEFMVIGSGREVASCRLVVGFSPEDAIKSASHEDPYTSNIVRVFDY